MKIGKKMKTKETKRWERENKEIPYYKTFKNVAEEKKPNWI